MMLATALEKKGVNDGAAQKILTKYLELLGYREVVLKSDGERALVFASLHCAFGAPSLPHLSET